MALYFICQNNKTIKHYIMLSMGDLISDINYREWAASVRYTLYKVKFTAPL